MGEAAEVYAEQLGSLFYGHPLWFPEPTDAGETQIGDVGILENGQLHRLFNITVAADHPWNSLLGVPEDFVPVDINKYAKQRRPNYLSPGPFASHSVKTLEIGPQVSGNVPAIGQVGVSYRFECSKEHGALLALNHPGVRESIFRSKELKRYIAQNHRTWHAFLNQRGVECRLDEMICVYGWIKTSGWTVAAFMNEGWGHDCLIQGQLGPFATVGCDLRITNSRQMSVQQRSGPANPEQQTASGPDGHLDAEPQTPRPASLAPIARTDNQTIFIEYYKVKYRPLLPTKVYKAAAGPHELPGPDRDGYNDAIESLEIEPSIELESVPSTVPARSPLDPVLDYLLEYSHADIAIVGHDQLYPILETLGYRSSWRSDLSESLKRVFPKIDVEDGVATLHQLSQRYSEVRAAKPKTRGACSRCKGLNVKCEFKKEAHACKRCLDNNYECTILDRKIKRQTLPNREQVLENIRKQAEQIRRLMAGLQDETAMEGQSDAFDARSSLSDTTESNTLVSSHATPSNVKHITKADKANVLDRLAKARVSIEELIKIPYFRPSSTVLITEDHKPPHILRSGLISPEEAGKLFQIYWDYVNPSVSLLDPVLYTAQNTYWRSPFLFTAICSIASRFYTPRPELYRQAIYYAQLAAGTALIDGQSSVDAVHAYILLSLYPVPVRKWEDDRSWIYLGLAIRIAMDLNLHQPNTAEPRNEQHAREILNRTRAWLNCFNLDRSMSSQYGKPMNIPNADYTANHSDQWWNSSPYNMKGSDIYIAGYTAELIILADFHAKIQSDPGNLTSFVKEMDIAALASEKDDELAHLWEIWNARVREHNAPNDAQGIFRTGLLRLAYSYARMNVLSFGLQYAFGKASVGQDMPLLGRCLRAAMDVLKVVLEEKTRANQLKYLRYGPEAQGVFVILACAFLIELLHPRYMDYISLQARTEIRRQVQQIADLFRSPEVAIDDHHGPKLYSHFLQGLLSSPPTSFPHMKSMSQSNSAHPSVEPEVGTSLPTDSYATQIADSSELQFGDSSFVIQPLPFEQSINTMKWVTCDPSFWGDLGVMPGFAWMG